MTQTSKLFSILLFSLSLFAQESDILTEYRKNGIDNIEKKLDKRLASLEYWNGYLHDKDTTFTYTEKYKNILLCDKSTSTLDLYQKDEDGEFILQQQYSAFTGKEKGDKQSEGDLKTPVGIYNLTKKITKVDSFYGPMAFVTSYPNLYDKYRSKTGQGIWIHGLPLHQERDNFTKGCIAIENKSIECLDRHIDINNTILLISQTKPKQVSKKEYAVVLKELFAWRYAWIYNNLTDYLHFYSPDFRRFDGMDIQAFSSYKKRIFAKNEKKSIRITDISVIPYPETPQIFRVTFHEKYRSESFVFNGNKELIVKLDDEGKKIQIITER